MSTDAHKGRDAHPTAKTTPLDTVDRADADEIFELVDEIGRCCQFKNTKRAAELSRRLSKLCRKCLSQLEQSGVQHDS